MKKIILIFILIIDFKILLSQELNVYEDLVICENLDTNINVPNNFDGYEFTWLFNGNTYSSDSSIQINESGNYSIILYDSIFIDSTFISIDSIFDSFDVILEEEEFDFIVSFNNDLNIDSIVEICIENNPVLETNQYDKVHFWYLDNNVIGEDTMTENTIEILNILDLIDYNYLHEFYVEIENSCGIIASKNIVSSIFNECNCSLNMPNIFTPNADNFNNEFKPINNHNSAEDFEKMCKSTDYSVEIFNQWGKHIISLNSNNNFPSWNGENTNGKEVPEGVYSYKINYKINRYTNSKKREIIGFFHLYR
ncbi:MAG: hypothetical protein CMD07_04635 [Flavobacteriales bacterium]|nr:hypothetical protein [Flavobacteriales bacterium]